MKRETDRRANPHIGVPLTVGPVKLSSNLLLAPIAGYCDLAFRVVCRERRGASGEPGLGLACTDLLSPHGLLRGSMHSLDLAMTNELDRPICMQLYGAEGEILAEGARWAVDHGASVVDINMGCPVDKVTKKNGGSTLLRDPCNTVKMAETVVRAVESASGGRVPVTAKMRLGWCDGTIVAPMLARDLERAGIQLVTVHGRTTEQKFTGSVRPEGIARVVEAVEQIPVLGNGDVTTAGGVIELMEKTRCAGVMIGRGALSSPWIFAQAWALQRATNDEERAAAVEEPTLLEKIAIVRRYLDLMVEYRGERYAMNHMRRRITWFAKKLGPCKPLRERVRTAETPGMVHGALDEFAAGGLRWYSQGAFEVDDEVGAVGV